MDIRGETIQFFWEKPMSTRILSFGNNLKHLNICIEEKIVGFKHMFSQSIENDLLYIVIKANRMSYCCARAIISFTTDYNPWDNPELYPLCCRIKNIEFCKHSYYNFLKILVQGKHGHCHLS